MSLYYIPHFDTQDPLYWVKVDSTNYIENKNYITVNIKVENENKNEYWVKLDIHYSWLSHWIKVY